MWRNPKYFPPAEGVGSGDTLSPPEPRGQVLAAFPRKAQGVECELRISMDEFNGHPFVSVRVWERGRDGRWWPVKGKGVSVRLGELAGVVDALNEAIGLAGEYDRQQRPIRGGNGEGRTPYPPRDDGRPNGAQRAPLPGRAASPGEWQRDRRPEPPQPEGPPDAESDAF